MREISRRQPQVLHSTEEFELVGLASTAVSVQFFEDGGLVGHHNTQHIAHALEEQPCREGRGRDREHPRPLSCSLLPRESIVHWEGGGGNRDWEGEGGYALVEHGFAAVVGFPLVGENAPSPNLAHAHFMGRGSSSTLLNSLRAGAFPELSVATREAFVLCGPPPLNYSLAAASGVPAYQVTQSSTIGG